MASWHERSCRKPDVAVVDSMPTCLSCGSFYSGSERTHFSELNRASSESQTTSAYLNLDWPSTVDFSSPDEIQDTKIRNTMEKLEVMLEANGNSNLDQTRDNNIDTRSKSAATRTHEGISEEVAAGAGFDPGVTDRGQEGNLDDTTAPMEFLVYNSLKGGDEVRLLHLSPRNSAGDQVLHGTLESTSLFMRPDYTAVSYTWADADGNRSLSEEIFLGDLWTPLPITPNCAAALRRLRSGYQIRTLWVDSICINQASTDEKSHQVGLMRDIFSRATSVTIFLGDDEDSPDARLLKRTSESLFYNENQGDVIWTGYYDGFAAQALFDRPYWSRIWVIQEVLLSKKATVVLGQTAIPLQSLLNARLLDPGGHQGEFSVPSWLRLENTLPIEDFHGLSRLLTETSTCLATDPKDMIFALLGLVQGARLEGLVADYSKSIHEIRVGIAAYFLIRHGQMDMLKSAAFEADVRQKGGLIPGSLSWVPSWNQYPRPDFTYLVNKWCWDDLKSRTDLDTMLRCYEVLRSGHASNASLDYSRSNASVFRVIKGSGALLAKVHPLLRIGSASYRGAFKYRSLSARSGLLLPSGGDVRWGIYATRMTPGKPFEFGAPGDWIVEIPGCDEFVFLEQIFPLPGSYRIASVCGLAIAVAWMDGFPPDDEVPPPTIESFQPRYGNDELISRLVIFVRYQLHFLEKWEHWAPSSNIIRSSSGESVSDKAESSISLSAEDIRQYVQWADRIIDDPLVATQPTSLGDTLRHVESYLDRWQDIDLWDRINSELRAVPWSSILRGLSEVRRGLWPEQPLASRISGEKHYQSLPTLGVLTDMTIKLRELLLGLTSRGTPLRPASAMDTFGPLIEALDETDTSTILEVFKASEDQIKVTLTELVSHMEFMRDSLPECHAIRDKFTQRQVLKQLYKKSELRDFLIY